MLNTYKKVVNQTSIEVTKTTPEATLTEVVPAKVEVVEYKREFLDSQKINVAKDLADLLVKHTEELASLQDKQTKEVATAQSNIDEVNALIIECDKLGIV